MNRSLRSFFLRQERRAERQNVLAAALLCRGGLGYLARRGGIMFARVPLRVALHAAEVMVIANFLELGALGYLLLVRSVAVALGALHWGALEPLRQRVRGLGAQRELDAARLEIARFVRIAVDWSIALLALLVAWYELGPRPFDGFSIIDAYAVGCTLRAIADVFTRTYHAGAFALRRVYRPFWSMVVVDAVEVGSVIALWPYLGPWGFALSQLLGGACDAVLSFRYTRRAYRALGLTLPRAGEVLSERARPEPGTWAKLVGPALGNLASQVDALLITALALADGSGAGMSIAAGLHVLRPVLSVGTNWARLFYFDLSRLEPSLQSLLRPRLERLLLQAAPLFALGSAAMGVLVTFAFSGQAVVAPVLWMLPLLAARSLYATAQIQAFSRGDHARLGLSGLLVAFLAFTLARSTLPVAALLIAAPLSLLLAAALFLGRRRADSRMRAEEGLLGPLTFLGALRAVSIPVTLHWLTLAPETGARAFAVARTVARSHAVRWVTSPAPNHLLIACHESDLSRAELVRTAAGTLRGVQRLEAIDGTAAIRACHELGYLGEPSELSLADLKSRFRLQFPNGAELSAHSGALPRKDASPRELNLMLKLLGQLASGVRVSRRRGRRAAVYAPRGVAQLVLIAPRGADPVRFAELERELYRASIRDSVTQ